MAIEIPHHLVAFIDLLGFSEMVRADCESSDHPQYLQRLYEVHQNASSIFGTDIESGIMQFSDSIVVSRPFSIADLPTFVRQVGEWQRSLLLKGLLCRGGITFGKHFVKDRFMFSKGLIDAYHLEKTEARFPRIVISKDLLDLSETEIDVADLSTVQEDDSVVFVDYLIFQDEKQREELLAAVEKICSDNTGTPSVREKLRWLSSYADYRLASKMASPRFVEHS